MTKAELVRRMAQGAAITQPQAAHALRALLESVQLAPRQGARVTLAGFGTCAVRSRAARKGRDRRTGQDLLVPACKLPRFTTGKRLRAAILSR